MGPCKGEEIIGDIEPKMGIDADGTSILFWIEALVILFVIGPTAQVFVVACATSLVDLVSTALERVATDLLFFGAID